MNREFLHKITLLGCLFLLITSSSGTDNGFQTPEQYAQIVQEHFANEEWEAGKELLEEGLQKYPNVSDLEWLMGKYWFHEKNYDQSRYHLVKISPFLFIFHHLTYIHKSLYYSAF